MCCMYARTWALHIMCVNTNICVVSMCIYEYCAWCVHTICTTWLQFIYLTYDYFTCVIWQLRKISTTDEIVYEYVVYMCTHLYMLICVCVWVYTYIYMHMYECMYVCSSEICWRASVEILNMYISTHMYSLKSVCWASDESLNIDAYVYVHTHTNTHTHI